METMLTVMYYVNINKKHQYCDWFQSIDFIFVLKHVSETFCAFKMHYKEIVKQ